MIIGEKDKERVRKLELEVRLARELFEHIKYDLRIVRDKCKVDLGTDSTIIYPYTTLSENIGKIDGHLEYFK